MKTFFLALAFCLVPCIGACDAPSVGSTAEKVTRGCRQPVLVLPSTEGAQD